MMVSFLTALGQTPNVTITVTADKSSYLDGNTINISGTVSEQLNIPVSIVIRDSSKNIVYIAQTNPNSDNTYSTQAIAGGEIWKSSGTYEIDVSYGGPKATAKTTFQFIPTNQQPISGNQTNANQTVPEFGPVSTAVFATSIIIGIILYTRVRPFNLFK